MLLAATGSNPSGLWEKLLEFFTSFERMFPGFLDAIETARIPFVTLAFVLITWSLIRRLSSFSHDPSHNLKAVTKAVVLTGMVALSMPLLQLTADGFNDLATSVGYRGSPAFLQESIEEAIVAYTHTALEEQEGTGGGEVQHGILYYIFHPGEAVQDGSSGVVNAFYGMVVQLVIFILTAFYKLAQLVMWVFWLIQQFIVHFSSIFLPAFVAMIGVGAVSNIGYRYIMGLIGVLAWPLAWAFVNVGTEGLMNAAAETINNAGGWDIGSYLWAGAIILCLPVWIIFGYLFGPFMIQRMVTTGANAAQSMIGNMAAMGTRTVGAGATLGAAALAGGGSGTLLGGAAASGGGSGAGEGTDGSVSRAASRGSEVSDGVSGLAGSYESSPSPSPSSGGSHGGDQGKKARRAAMNAGMVAAVAGTVASAFDDVAQEGGASASGGKGQALLRGAAALPAIGAMSITSQAKSRAASMAPVSGGGSGPAVSDEGGGDLSPHVTTSSRRARASLAYLPTPANDEPSSPVRRRPPSA
ncbi:hypothetical protein [Haloferula sargassicola]|uniref:TrbL/VirB6 plasmid conjugal transfer protein n=1 Tax=Haloferula sargassicola TaxID=490096 RepID=A0ABP9UTI6_9BACT